MSNYSDPRYEIDDSLDVIRWSDVRERIPKLFPFEAGREESVVFPSFATREEAQEYADDQGLEVTEDEEVSEELDALRELLSDLSPFGENAFAVSEDFMVDFAIEEAESIDGITQGSLVFEFVNWKNLAESLKQDMTRVMFRGTAYWIRG